MGLAAPVSQGSEVHLDSIGQIAITVSDLAKSKQFYRDVLGMTFLFDAGAMAFFQCGAIRLMIGLAETPITRRERSCTFG